MRTPWAELPTTKKAVFLDRRLEREASREYQRAVGACAWVRNSAKRERARLADIRARCIAYVFQKRGLRHAA